jgi:ABC-type transport system substrate-binding protein
MLLLSLTGCTLLAPTPAPIPQITFTPRPTATALPTATPSPTPTQAPQPEPTATPSSGYYRAPEQGFWLHYPESWQREETGASLPAVIIRDDNDPLRLLVGSRPVEAATDQDATERLTAFAETVGTELGLAEEVDLLSNTAATLAEGLPAREITLTWDDEEDRTYHGKGYATLSNDTGYVLLLVAHPEVLETREHTLETIAQTFHVAQPEIFGVSRENALVLIHPEIETLDPALTHESAAGIVGHIFSGLVRLNAELRVEPDLAARWDVSEDGTTYTFHLRPDAAFHSGRAVTAQDVKAAWERATDPALGSLTAPRYLGDIVGAEARLAGETETLSGVEVIDDQTLKVTFDGPKPYALAKLAQPAAFVTHADNATGEELWWRHPDGTGPFALQRWREDDVLILERYADHVPAPAEVSAVLYYLAGSTGFAAYETGKVDVAHVGPHHLDRVTDPADPLSGELVEGHTFCTELIVFDATRPPFDDPDARRAFTRAVDRPQIADVVLNGGATPATGYLAPGMPGYVERPLTDTLDVDAARQLLPASSQELTLRLTAPGRGEPSPMLIALTEMWESALGVTIETQLIDPLQYPRAVAEDHGHLFVLPWCAEYPDPQNVLDVLFHSEGPVNYGGYQNAQVDELLEAARTEPETAVRLEHYQEAEHLLLQDAPALPVVHPLTHVLVKPYVRGYQQTPIPVLWPAHVSIER